MTKHLIYGVSTDADQSPSAAPVASPAAAVTLPTDAPTREQIDRLKSELFALVKRDGEVVIIPEDHHAEGLYGRSILIPAGTALTGAAHKAGHLNVCVGDIDVWTEDGMKRLTGINVIPSRPGCKRAGFAHADTWWLTVHVTLSAPPTSASWRIC